ncbi:hypothetical protein LEP1GSC193_1141 [Leptospira alstonii serovar Pingchang str. 80-412]|uniref:Uncharacterized protein n=2 Tax=Leptospira alstonii TaxID=28452 RepID=M6CRU9_9LEPT|nr:hypothetical protein LEP1GSC194_2829 [Leptospira alstonii serovar Sichuan str. 79601]EQA82600.1 hypothetical protein LEP1GSC193_1141 [Leptospira alstonii serovar Pingchang str. 80-412]
MQNASSSRIEENSLQILSPNDLLLSANAPSLSDRNPRSGRKVLGN